MAPGGDSRKERNGAAASAATSASEDWHVIDLSDDLVTGPAAVGSRQRGTKETIPTGRVWRRTWFFDRKRRS